MPFNCLYIIDRLIRFAGTEKHLLQLTRAMKRNGIGVKVIAFQASRAMQKGFQSHDVEVASLDLDRMYGKSALPKFFSLVQQIRRFNPAIVQTFHFKSDTYGVAAAKLAGCRTIISSRRDMGQLKSRRQRLLNRAINPLINSFVAVCENVKRNLIRMEGIPKEKIFTLYNGVEIDHFRHEPTLKQQVRMELGIGPEKVVVGTVCILRPEKDVKLLLQGIAAMRKNYDNLVALIVGDGPCRDQLRQISQELNIGENTIFTGYQDDTRKYLSAIDIACLTPSENEGLSNSLLEKMAMGKPVLTTDVGGNAEIVVHGKTGFVIRRGDLSEFIRYLKILIDDRELRDVLGTAGRRHIESFFSIEAMVRNHRDLYANYMVPLAN